MILLIYIYYLKNFLSISDIKNLLDPLNEHFDDQDSKNSFYTIYNEIFKLEHDHNTAIRDSIADVFHKSEATFAELKESKKKEQLQQFAFITLLGYDIYLRKQAVSYTHLWDYLIISLHSFSINIFHNVNKIFI